MTPAWSDRRTGVSPTVWTDRSTLTRSLCRRLSEHRLILTPRTLPPLAGPGATCRRRARRARCEGQTRSRAGRGPRLLRSTRRTSGPRVSEHSAPAIAQHSLSPPLPHVRYFLPRGQGKPVCVRAKRAELCYSEGYIETVLSRTSPVMMETGQDRQIRSDVITRSESAELVCKEQSSEVYLLRLTVQ